MDRVLRYWEVGYFTNAIWLFLTFLGLIVSFRKGKNSKNFKPLTIYFLSHLILNLIAVIDLASKPRFDPFLRLFFSYFDLAVTIIEITVFTQIIRGFVITKSKKIILKATPLTFICCILVALVINKNGFKLDQIFLQRCFTLQALFLILACILYYIELFKLQPVFQLFDQPSFWIITGLSFFMICTLPFSIFGEALMVLDYQLYLKMFCIFNVFHCILGAMILRAYWCKPEQGKTQARHLY